MAYNLDNLTNATNLVDVVTFSNDVVDGMLINMFVISVTVILFMVMKRTEFSKSFLTITFIMTLVSGFLWFGHLLNWRFPFAYGLFMSIAVIVAWFRRDK